MLWVFVHIAYKITFAELYYRCFTMQVNVKVELVQRILLTGLGGKSFISFCMRDQSLQISTIID